MHIVLFGGSFNPPHNGHLLVLQQAPQLIPSMDELWLLPAYDHTFGKNMAPPQHRLAMLSLLSPTTKICTKEIDNLMKGSTLETLHRLQSEYPNHQFSFLMGSDQIASFHKWIDYQKLLKELPFYVYPRKGYPYTPTYPQMHFLDGHTQIATSSTQIRELLKTHSPISHLLPPAIENYVSQHHLYT